MGTHHSVHFGVQEHNVGMHALSWNLNTGICHNSARLNVQNPRFDPGRDGNSQVSFFAFRTRSQVLLGIHGTGRLLARSEKAPLAGFERQRR